MPWAGAGMSLSGCPRPAAPARGARQTPAGLPGQGDWGIPGRCPGRVGLSQPGVGSCALLGSCRLGKWVASCRQTKAPLPLPPAGSPHRAMLGATGMPGEGPCAGRRLLWQLGCGWPVVAQGNSPTAQAPPPPTTPRTSCPRAPKLLQGLAVASGTQQGLTYSEVPPWPHPRAILCGLWLLPPWVRGPSLGQEALACPPPPPGGKGPNVSSLREQRQDPPLSLAVPGEPRFLRRARDHPPVPPAAGPLPVAALRCTCVKGRAR